MFQKFRFINPGGRVEKCFDRRGDILDFEESN
jgi:hypothetical protein